MGKRILFIHHSTGAYLIRQGRIRQRLAQQAPELELWDHGYNLYGFIPPVLIQPFAQRFTFHTGLSDAHGRLTGTDYALQLGNNDPADYTHIFTSNPHQSPLQDILSYEVIIFKNCYPTTKIESDSQLARYKQEYRSMRTVFMQYPEKLFIPFTPPPLREELTHIDYAARARRFAEWLVSEDFHQNRKNIAVFDFFSLLADDDAFLKREYCRTLYFDSHPNVEAHKHIGPIFVDFLLNLFHL